MVLTPPRQVSCEDFFDNDSFSMRIFTNKYALIKEDSTSETPAETFWRIAKYVASAEPNKEQEEKKALEWFELMMAKKFLPGGRIIYGAANPAKVSLINCTGFALGIDRNGKSINPDSLEAISETGYLVSKVESRGEGVGVDISALRPRHSKTNNAAKTSTGAVSWMDLYSKITGTVAQQGRRGALLLLIDDSHPDSLEFINIKNDNMNTKEQISYLEKHITDDKSKTIISELYGKIEETYKVRFANISLKISDALMSAYLNKETWSFIWDRQVHSSIAASKYMELLSETAYSCAEPGVLFWNTSKRMSNSDAVGYPVVSVNACSEEVLSNGSSCTLANINFSLLPEDEEEMIKELTYLSGEVLHFLDNVVTCQLRDKRCPTKLQKKDLKALRRVGVGFTGLGDYLLKREVPYDSPEAATIAETLARTMCVAAYRRSFELAQERGSYKAFKWPELKTSEFIRHLINSGAIQEHEFEKGMRNVCCLTVPPAGTGSIILGTSSGVEPIMDAWYYRRTRVIPDNYPLEWRWELIIHPLVREIIINKEKIDILSLNTDKEKIDLITKVFDGKVKPAHGISYLSKINLMGKVQKWIDASISATYNLDSLTSSPATVLDIYVEAWKAGLKGCTVYVQHPEAGREPVILFREKPKSYNFSFSFIDKYGSPYAKFKEGKNETS